MFTLFKKSYRKEPLVDVEWSPGLPDKKLRIVLFILYSCWLLKILQKLKKKVMQVLHLNKIFPGKHSQTKQTLNPILPPNHGLGAGKQLVLVKMIKIVTFLCED